MCRVAMSLIFCGMLAGCVLFPAAPAVTLHPIPDTPNPMASPVDVAAIPAGSKISVQFHHEDMHTTTTGEVLHASPQGLALMNVKQQSRVMTGTPVLNKVPYISRLFKNTSVGQERMPVHWVPRHLISTVDVLEPPPPGYVAPQLAIDTTDGTDFERIGIDFDFNVEAYPAVGSEDFVVPLQK